MLFYIFGMARKILASRNTYRELIGKDSPILLDSTLFTYHQIAPSRFEAREGLFKLGFQIADELVNAVLIVGAILLGQD